MKELEYINTTNLTKLRLIRSLISDLFPDEKLVSSKNIQDICLCVDSLVTKLEKVVKCS